MNTSRTFRARHLLGAASALLALTVTATLATAAGPSPQATVDARVAGFKKMGGAFKAISDQLKTGAPAKATVVAAAQTIATTAKAQPKLFPANTAPGAGIKTDALPAIWKDRAKFDAQMNALIAESGKLATVANSGDAAALAAQFKATGATCKGCHQSFRADD